MIDNKESNPLEHGSERVNGRRDGQFNGGGRSKPERVREPRQHDMVMCVVDSGGHGSVVAATGHRGLALRSRGHGNHYSGQLIHVEHVQAAAGEEAQADGHAHQNHQRDAQRHQGDQVVRVGDALSRAHHEITRP